jgi:hypothetical protein
MQLCKLWEIQEGVGDKEKKSLIWRQGHSCRELLEDASDVDIIQPAQRNPCAFGRVLLDQVKGIHKHAKIPYGSHSL